MDKENLKKCFSRFSTGVTIACTSFENRFYGMTVNSFSSVSLKPPLLLFSIDNKSHNLHAFKNAKTFAISILSKDQVNLAREFSISSNEDKWKSGKYFLKESNSPIFEDSIAYFECRVYNIIIAGDHNIVIGEILSHETLKDSDPLIYFQSRFS